MTIRSRYTAAITDNNGIAWWLPPGISYSTCTNAYQGKGAKNYISSQMNLASNNYNMLVVGTGLTWSALTGWALGTNYNNRLTFVVPGSTSTIIVKFSDATEITNNLPNVRGIFGLHDAYGVIPNTSAGLVWKIKNVNQSAIAPDESSGFLAMQRQKAFRNGVVDLTYSEGGYTNKTWFIGGTPGNIQAIAVYNVNLSEEQITSIGNAMNAL